jgi:hypothetical protein
MSEKEPVELQHNLEPAKFMWLWMKYVSGVNDQCHCTNCLRGKYGKFLSKHNAGLASNRTLTLDEQPANSYYFIYVCGVIKKGYPRTNYPHNLHAVIRPKVGSLDSYQFENWELGVTNGVFEPIPNESELPAQYRNFPPKFTTCRIFRWAVCSSLNPNRTTSGGKVSNHG